MMPLPLISEMQRRSARVALCRAFLEVEAEIRRHVDGKLSSRPHLESLFRIYLAELEGRQLYQASLSTDDILSKPHRRALRLIELGALVREVNDQDHRCRDLRLAPATKDSLEHLIDVITYHCLAVAAEITEHGSGEALIPSEQIRYDLSVGTNEETSALDILRGKVIAGGRIALPAEVRRKLDLHRGDTVLFEVHDDEVRIRSARAALRKIQRRLQEFAPDEGLVSEELVAERRAEAERD